MQASYTKYILNFKRPGGTSRGVLHTKESWFIKITDGAKTGFGECGVLRGLSADDRTGYEEKLAEVCASINKGLDTLYHSCLEWPSIQFGLEQAFKDLEAEEHILFPSDFSAGTSGQPINGLIWMGDEAFMKQQVSEKLEAGFSVLKMKIGAIGLEKELHILKELRKSFSADSLQLRVDANGAFKADEVGSLLETLAQLQVHSIEQPIKAGQWMAMAQICANAAIPVALDEELIGLFNEAERQEMLATIKPQYTILKPSFVGGFYGSENWIKLAEKYNAGWWATSALESNIGLNAIAQWNATKQNNIPSGLGTGSLFTNNFESPMRIENGEMRYFKNEGWNLNLLEEAFLNK